MLVKEFKKYDKHDDYIFYYYEVNLEVFNI